MKSLTTAKAWTTAAAAVLLLASASSSHAATNTKLEAGCFAAMGKAVGKHLAAVSKAMVACESETPGACPDADAQAAIDKSLAKVIKAAASKCHSTCSVSGADCINNLSCPPNGALTENCTAGAKGLPFNSNNMGLPGPFCEAVLGRELGVPSDIGECMGSLGTTIGQDLLDNAGINSTGLTGDAPACLAAILKSVGKTASKNAAAVAACRVAQLGSDSPAILPDQCPQGDPKTAAKIAVGTQKFLDSVAAACTDAAVQQLDICGAGVGGVTTEADALECLGDVLEEATHSIANVEDKNYIDISVINAVFPGTTDARCGDNFVNQIPSQFFLVGEECDGTDDSACPGACFPPGDLWECTCATVKRARSFADGFAADLDNGWSGASHNSAVTDGAGFVSTMSNCDCDQFGNTPETQANCVGTSSDSVCDVLGKNAPRCTYDLTSGLSCDQHGNNNGSNSTGDCQVCDENSINAGDYCESELDCDSQCFNADGIPTTPCEAQADCPEGETCRGRCDKESYSCLILHNGAPLPLNAEGTSVCVDSRYASNITGTRNIVTGEHAVNYELRSLTHLAEALARPCPTCGGWCEEDTPRAGEVCEGTCDGTEMACRAGANAGDPCMTDAECPGSVCVGLGCRFDSDCPNGASCTTQSYECLGAECVLDLICYAGANHGSECRVEAFTAFGTTSVDCPPQTNDNISGAGLEISFTPLTSEAVALENPAPCDATGYQNYDCNCVTGGSSTRNQPNRCTAACDAGPNYGEPCGGAFSKCVGGTEAGVSCDEDSDCGGGGTCSSNPLACTGGTDAGNSCTTNGDCGGGGTCGDACPSGRCVPLCVQKGVCVGGTGDGLNCGVDAQCDGGGTCVVTEPQEGVCAAGGRYHCNGPGQEFRTCSRALEGTTGNCEAGADNIDGTTDDNPGAGICVFDVSNCFVNDGAAEGGDTLNGLGDATNALSVTTFCIPASGNSAVNATAGLPGPGRLRQPSTVVPNYTSLP
ncbi:MAG TPA: hypothetical protein VEC57_05290 [Candidatus Limnocylindrales bacterium]|nr:hypothetical protein [Candidatus Limnocylindrales bacterium]